MRITKSWLLLFLFYGEVLYAQNNTTNDPDTLKAGIYLTEKDFIDNTPWEVPFTVSKKYHTKKVIDNEELQHIDTVDISYVYQLADSTKNLDEYTVYGFCDGVVRYYIDPNKERLLRKTRYYKLEEKSKYPFLLVNPGPHILLFLVNPAILITGAITSTLVSSELAHKEVWYFNKKGELRKATPQSISWFLRDDPDLQKQYNNERKVSNAIYIKYLVLMNNRYHYKGYQEIKLEE